MTTTRTTPSRAVCERFLAALLAQHPWVDDPRSGPQLVMDWDWLGYGGHPSIVWEGGPYEWAALFPFGGIDQEYGFRRADVSARIPKGWYAEPITSWAVGIYRV